MRPLLRPTLLRLALLALGLVLVPPFLAVASAMHSLGVLAASGEEAATRAGAAVGGARDLVDHARAMERHARQRAILEDDAFLDLYRTRRDAFVRAVDALEAAQLPEPLAARLVALRDAANGDDTPEHLSGLTDTTEAFLAAASDTVAEDARRLHSEAAAVEARLLRTVVWSAPVVALTLAFVLFSIVRPLRRLDAAVQRIGAGELDTPVVIGGTHDLRAVGARVAWLQERLAAVHSDRIRLFRHLSHELKTPLASLREGSQLLLDGVTGPLSPAQHEITTILRANTDLLHQRIEDLLRLGELRAEASVLVREPLDLSVLVSRVLADHQIPALSHDLRVRATLSEGWVLGDSARLRTVVDNLVGNAVKFSPDRGAVDVRLTTEARWLHLDVTDEGPGVHPSEAERVFEAFYQGAAGRQGHVSGTGIGLTLAREYARAHDGDVRLLPSVRGAHLRLTLPRHVAP